MHMLMDTTARRRPATAAASSIGDAGRASVGDCSMGRTSQGMFTALWTHRFDASEAT